MLRDVFEAAASYIQYLMLVFQIRPRSFPDFFTSPVDVLNYVNLDLLSVFDESTRYKNTLGITVPLWVPLDFRLQFAVVSVIGPLLLSIVGTFFLASKVFFMWFTLLLGGAFVLIVTTCYKVDPELMLTTIGSSESWDIAFYAGISVTATAVACGAAAFAWTSFTEAEQQEDEKRELAHVVETEVTGLEAAIEMFGDSSGGTSGKGDTSQSDAQHTNGPVSRKERLDHIMQLETAELDVVASVTRASYFLVFFVLGLFLARVVEFGALDTLQHSDVLYALSGVVMMFAAVMLGWLVLGLFRSGRELQFRISVWMRDNFVSMLLLLVAVVYTPAVTNIVATFDCQPVTCYEGFHLPIPMSAMDISSTAYYSTTRGSTACFPCNFTEHAPQQCPSSLQDALCGQNVTESRLSSDVSVPCSSIGVFFNAASAIMLVCFVVTTPWVYFILTNRSTVVVDSDFPLDARQVEGYTDEERYEEKVHLSDNVAKFIYDPFSRYYKHWRMLVIVQKILIVVISVITRGDGSVEVLRNGAIGIGASLFVHAAYLIYVAVSRPFLRKAENIFCIVTQSNLCLVCLMGLSASLGLEWPRAAAIVVATLVVAGPVVGLMIGAVFTFRDDVLREKAREERVRLAQQAAEDESGEAGKQIRRSSQEFSLVMDTQQALSPQTQSPRGSSSASSPRVGGASSAQQQTTTITAKTNSTRTFGRMLRSPSNNSLTSSTTKLAVRGFVKHSRPRWDNEPVAAAKAQLIPGGLTPLSRFRLLPRQPQVDESGRPTLVASLREKAATANGCGVGLLKKGGSFSGSSTDIKGTSITSASGALPPNAKLAGGGAFGAAAANMRRTVRRNTAEESERARDNWALAKLRVMCHIQDVKEQEEKESRLQSSGGVRMRAKSFVAAGTSANKQRLNKGKQWDNFLASLLNQDSSSTTPAAAVIRRNSSGTKGPAPAVLDVADLSVASQHSSNSSNNSSPLANSLTPVRRGTSSQNLNAAVAHAPPVVDTMHVGFDPLQRAKDKRKKIRDMLKNSAARAIEQASNPVSTSDPNRQDDAAVAAGAVNSMSRNTSFVGSQKGSDVGSPLTPKVERGNFDQAKVDDIEDHFRSIQGGAAGRRQHIQLRLKLQAIYDAQLKKLQLTQQAVDFRVNKDTIQILNRFFVFLGLFALVALALATVGSMSKQNTTFFTGVTFNSDMSAARQFVGYGTWTNFTAHCCCVASTSQDASWPYYIVDIEEWLCENGRVKERVRKAFSEGVLLNGYTIRPLCATSFSDGCSPSVAAGGLVNFTGCATPGMPSYADRLLW